MFTEVEKLLRQLIDEVVKMRMATEQLMQFMRLKQ